MQDSPHTIDEGTLAMTIIGVWVRLRFGI